MNAKGRDDVALHALFSGLDAQIGAVEMETRQSLVERQTRRTPRDQEELINREGLDDTCERCPEGRLETGRVNKAVRRSVIGDSKDSQHSPFRIDSLQLIEGGGEVTDPRFWQVHILMSKYHNVVRGLGDAGVVGPSGTFEPPPDDDLASLVDGRGLQEGLIEDAVIRHSDDQRPVGVSWSSP